MKRSLSPFTDISDVDSPQNQQNTPLNRSAIFRPSQSEEQHGVCATTVTPTNISTFSPQASVSGTSVKHCSAEVPSSVMNAASRLSNLNSPFKSALQKPDVRAPPYTVNAATLSPTSTVDYLNSQSLDPSVKQPEGQPLVSSFQPPASAQLPVVNTTSSQSSTLNYLSSEASCSTSSLNCSNDQNIAEEMILTKEQVQNFFSEMYPNLELDDDVAEMLQETLDIFVTDTITKSCILAKHRKSNILEAVDVALHLKQNCNMVIPGYGPPEPKPYNRHVATAEHKKRLSLVYRASKNFARSTRE